MAVKIHRQILRTVYQHCDENKAFTPAGERWKIFNADTNGMNELMVIVRINNRVYFDESRYPLWVELQNTGELDAVVKLIRQAKEQGNYLSPEDAVLQVRGVAVAHTGQPQRGNKREGRHATR
jgi:hypothetical protein